jgi:hypothetical protein
MRGFRFRVHVTEIEKATNKAYKPSYTLDSVVNAEDEGEAAWKVCCYLRRLENPIWYIDFDAAAIEIKEEEENE